MLDHECTCCIYACARARVYWYVCVCRWEVGRASAQSINYSKSHIIINFAANWYLFSRARYSSSMANFQCSTTTPIIIYFEREIRCFAHRKKPWWRIICNLLINKKTNVWIFNSERKEVWYLCLTYNAWLNESFSRLTSHSVRRNELRRAHEHLNAMTNEYFRRAGTQPRLDFDRSAWL